MAKFQSDEKPAGADALVKELMEFLHPSRRMITPEEAGRQDMQNSIQKAKEEIAKKTEKGA